MSHVLPLHHVKNPHQSHLFAEKMKCFYCKKRNHLANECRKKKQESSSTHSNAKVEHRLYVIKFSSIRADPAWYVDSDAIQRMTYNQNAFVNYTKLPKKEFIYLVDDSCQPIRDKGNVLISLNDSTDKVISDVLYIPALHKNLFSITQLVFQG